MMYNHCTSHRQVTSHSLRESRVGDGRLIKGGWWRHLVMGFGDELDGERVTREAMGLDDANVMVGV